MDKQSRTLTILGSTGSIGIQTLQVLESSSEKFCLGFITANSKIDILEEQANKFNPVGVAISDEKFYHEFRKKTSYKGKILCGKEGVLEAASYYKNDMVLSALVGFSGVQPTLAAINSSKTVALANKETLVSAGSIITTSAKEKNVPIIAVDSEHSAILQCLVGESIDTVEKIILTASGGPFWTTPGEEFESLTVEQALEHPNWSMGNKITIDSATMINKGFEVIEAHWIFGLPINKIEVLIHPQSIVHSMVQFIDGSVKAQLGIPDMRIPISYALNYPKRLNYDFPRLELTEIGILTFEMPDYFRFPCLKLAYEAIEKGGSATAVLNAANEIAVYAFLENKISLPEIASLIEKALNKIKIIARPTIDEIIDTDKETRLLVESIINENIK
ncbi:MAG: 1-deoxy-D-xylulose-5-phosphate reductoisomerase [Ignavibacteria bacterium GWB2_35_12]|nr:MAG: 1-deoxy-D-xylulose-5-phosphate reductoisomerase [Ignavibacteria bacterium GWA2_35_8]OGU39803.1 MAG: 1-deoxy-D-xylulose-5-phosphate reductoisomerase [Ignavibacteria bacterium GWB2_35_12]OGU95147.1 MAG: 1-deoxy-D-xylulose-5-phosphate reductoisomerase [Ignavibacteria bacterium RIFOXYA2_FULL_35_10]OGV21433.1 MAG: 1-deoxy-D-xylulose-5-phosphate reductoisomerase [Ignavibacteria bacterium RIFOXYC2_FULL_35_21]